MKRAFLFLLAVLFALPGFLACWGCRPRNGVAPDVLFRLRNLGRLQAARDTPEGFEEGAKAFAAALGQRSDLGDILNLARCVTLAGRSEEAHRVLESARKALPAGLPAPLELVYLEGLALKGLKSYDEAAARFREVTERDPGLEAGWYQLGTTRFLDLKHEEAIQAFQKLLELNPQHVAALYKQSMAFRALGQAARADECMARFLDLKKKAGQDASDESAYDRCKHTRVTLVPPVGAAPEPPPVALELEDATAAAGLSGKDATAAVLFDHDRDGDPDLYLVRTGPNKLLRNDRGRFTDVTELSDAGEPGDGIAAEPGDVNQDGIPDLLVRNRKGPCVLLKGLGEGVFQPLPGSGLALEGVMAAHWVDHDHDGDLDLAALEALPADAGFQAALHRNNGDETFTRQDGALPGTFKGASGSIALVDLDRGNDVDFVIGSDRDSPQAFLNLRSGPFCREPIPDTGLSGPLLAACDWNGDGEFDLVGVGQDAPALRVVLSRGARGPGKVPEFVSHGDAVRLGAPVDSLLSADLDNDGDLDVLAGRENTILWIENRGGKPRVSELKGVSAPRAATSSLSVAAADLEGDGKLDIISCGAGGRLTLWRNVTRVIYPAVTIRPIGSRDNRDGTGTHVELFAGSRYQRRLVEGSGAACGTGGVRFGLGDVALDALDGFELLWPNGIAQPLLREDLKWDAWRSLEVTQKRGLTVSCPFLYVHDGTRYHFLTDVVGIAPLDEWLPPGSSPRLDPEEYVRIPGEALRESHGRLRLAITEELRETTYLDRLEIVRITHPPGTVVYTDESTRQGEMEPLRVWVVKEEDILASPRVRGEGGREFSSEARLDDGVYLHPYESAPPQWAGWVPLHALDFEIPRGPSGDPVLLLLAGRIYWPDSSVTFALSQHGRSWEPPRLEALGAEGRVKGVVAELGFPCGMDRTMVLPLPAEACAGASALRVVTNHRFLWDRIAFAARAGSVAAGVDGTIGVLLGGEPVTIVRETLPFLSARLGHHGFSRVVGDMEAHEQTYDFALTTPAPAFQRPRGRATRYGDVLDLVRSPDSRLVVLAPGDGLNCQFDSTPSAARQAVTYFLQVTGWAKESSFHNPTGRSIGPLPFHGMEGYPPCHEGPRQDTDLTRTISDS